LKFLIDGTGTAFAPGQAYSYQIAQMAGQDLSTVTITNPAQFTAIGFLATGFSLTGSSNGALYVGFTPVPEPAHALGLVAATFGAGAWGRRRARGRKAGA